ncbi:MAG: hypothetical protein ISS11_08155 [Candidatus Marinimicrobia bacterium]|nr:hypothetical protein [Candidatus Neomarinimicrobiota bacterium]
MDIQLIGIANIIAISLLITLIIWRKNITLSIIFASGIIIRILTSVLQDKYKLFPYDWDEKAFYSTAQTMYEYFVGRMRVYSPMENINSVTSYGGFLGGIFYFFGNTTIVARLSNAFFGSLIILAVNRLAVNIGVSKDRALYVSAIIAFTPSYIVYSSLIMRDMIIWILLIIIVIQWVKTIKYNNYFNFIIGLVVAIILIPFRKQYVLILALFAMVVFMIVWFRKDIKYSNVRINSIKYLSITCLLIITVMISYQLLILEISRWGNNEIMEYFVSQLAWRAQGGSAYLTTLEYTSIFDIILYTPLKFVHFAFGPFLWTSSSPLVLLSAIESLIGTYFFVYLLLNYKHVLKMDLKNKSIIIFITLFAITGLIMSATIDSNYGTAMRHRMIFMPLIFVVALLLKDKINYKIATGNKYAH